MSRGEVALASGRSQVYALLSRAWQYPEESVYAWLPDEFGRALRQALRSCGAGLKAAVAAPEKSQTDLAVEYTSWFEVGSPRPPCPLCEGLYPGPDRLEVLKELVLFYRHFGLSPVERQAPPDHLCAELEFMHYLCFVEALARSEGRESQSYLRAQGDFLQRHPGRWLPWLKERIDALDMDHFYRRLGDTTLRWVQWDTRFLATRLEPSRPAGLGGFT